MPNYCYFNGKIMPLKRAKVNPYDLGLLRGYGVFDVMVTTNGKPFLMNDHWKRFLGSAKELGLKISVGKNAYEGAIKKLLKLNKFKKSIIRTVLTGGESSDGFTPAGKETFYILIEKFFPLPKEVFKRGAGVITLEYLRDCPQAKITNYVIAIKNLAQKKKKKALEIIYTHSGKALEATTSNFFTVKNGVIATPKESILFGITRKLVIRLAKRAGFKVLEKDVKTKELYRADEVFLTATNKDIVPVVRVNNKKIGTGVPGKVTKTLMEEFAKFVRNY